ncbi:fructose-specific PTS transporter subunit EIIC [Facklamia miroungae]|uniref:PTS system, fructose-specific IIC component n=1 Tax=Facklamia miroungae TaxID=120956 RepID=A0A1G7U9Q6_9LACT|nr:fructose-specific PTS transporter subunit EIIC [Facklamia miroungae]NKZ30016.1 PTS transporter subunit EIIA [Facklamia miroungae]SDG44164.1 PTS system, fructose-specific IIC component [Facklamia miroungae]
MSDKRIVAITSCPVGVAHTYMAAENLTKMGEELGVDVKVETHGSIGVENELTAQEIEEAEGVIIAADTKIDLARFAGKRVVQVGVQQGIQRPEDLINRILNHDAPIVKGEQRETEPSGSSEGRIGQLLYRSLMAGVSHMVPFVVTGGLLIAISLSLGGEPTQQGLVVPEDSYWSIILTIGATAMGLMIPILSAFIAHGIADRPGLVPGFVGGMIAANGALYGSEANAGFLGGIITGFLAGFIALGLKKIKVPKAVQSIMPIIIIPILSTLAVGIIFITVIGVPVTALFTSMSEFLLGLQGGSEIILAMILGAMIAVDMGGPFNKVAFLFGSGMIEQGNYEIMGPIAVAIAIPPIAMGLAPFVMRNKFSKAERETGKASFTMGLFGITEGAIPFATADPLRVIPSIVVGSMVGSVVAMLSNVTDSVAHGGPIVAVLGAVDNVLMFFAATIVGVMVTLIMLQVLKPKLKAPVRSTPLNNKTTPTETAAKQDTLSSTEAEVHQLTDIISENQIMLDLEAPTKEAAIDAMINKFAEENKITSVETFKTAVTSREAEGTTGIGKGIAIPHGKSDTVNEASVVFARSTPGLDWESLDGEAVHLIFMIAVPAQQKGDMHLKILQMLSRKLMDDDFRKHLMEAKNKEEVMRLLATIQ